MLLDSSSATDGQEPMHRNAKYPHRPARRSSARPAPPRCRAPTRSPRPVRRPQRPAWRHGGRWGRRRTARPAVRAPAAARGRRPCRRRAWGTHSGEVEILDHHDVASSGDHGGGLADGVVADGGHPSVFVGSDHQVAGAHVDADAAAQPLRVARTCLPADLLGDLACERHVPAAPAVALHRRGQDACGAVGEPAGELAGRLIGADGAHDGQGDVMPVGLDTGGTGGEPDRLRPGLPAEPGNPTGQPARVPFLDCARERSPLVRVTLGLGLPVLLGLGVLLGVARPPGPRRDGYSGSSPRARSRLPSSSKTRSAIWAMRIWCTSSAPSANRLHRACCSIPASGASVE